MINQQPNAMEINTGPAPAYQIKSSKKKIILIIVIVLAVILLAGGGVLAYFNYFQPPEMIVHKAISKMVDIKSLTYYGQVEIEVKIEDPALLSMIDEGTEAYDYYEGPPAKEGKIYIDIAGVADMPDPDTQNAMLQLTLSSDLFPEAGEFDFETRAINKILYIKIKFKESSETAATPFDFSSLNNQWIQFSSDAIKEKFAVGEMEEEEEDDKLSAEQKEQIRQAIKNAKIIKIGEKLPSEKINGKSTFHYKFSIDKKEVARLASEINEIVEGEPFDEEKLADLEESFESVEKFEGEIWVGKWDLLLRKILIRSTVKEEEYTSSEGKVTFRLLFENHNQPVQIEAPKSVRSLEDILNQLFGEGSFFGTGMEAYSMDSDLDGLPDGIEARYGTDPNNPDTDGDGFTDLEEIENGYNPLGPGELSL